MSNLVKERSIPTLRTTTSADQIRFLCVDQGTQRPYRSLALFEAGRASRRASPNTRRNELRYAGRLAGWCVRQSVDLDERLLTGVALESYEVDAFAHDVRQECAGPSALSVQYVNGILSACQRLCLWAVGLYLRPSPDINPADRAAWKRAVLEYQTALWDDQHVIDRSQPIARNLSDGDIAAIEAYLHPERRTASGVNPQVAWRDYLVWQVAIQYGLRIGEILALRVQDLPSRQEPYLSVVRIDARDPGVVDPRLRYAPRVKTLGRDLAQYHPSTLPVLLDMYVTELRYVQALAADARTRRYDLGHDYVFVAHDNGGQPVSIWSLMRLASTIRMGAKVPEFTWHRCRHAFFNRMYADVADQAVPTRDMQNFGGWRSSRSIDMYIRAAQQERTRQSSRAQAQELSR